MNPTIGILGGTGFVGHHLCHALANYPCQIRVFTRSPEKHRDLSVLPNLDLVQLNIHDPKDLAQGLVGCDVVINLVGILNQNFDDRFEKVHIELIRHLINICHKQNIKRFIHISALNADTKAPSAYLRSKGETEKLLNQSNHSNFHTTIFRPSVIFGHDDHFFNKFSHLLKLSPGFIVLPCADSLYAPIYVEDVVKILIQSINDKRTFEQTYDLCGPDVFSLKEIVRITAMTMNKKRWIIGLGPFLSNIAAHVLQFFPGKPLTPDNYLSTTIPSICKKSLPDFFNIKLQRVHAILPQYIGKEAMFDPYTSFRKM